MEIPGIELLELIGVGGMSKVYKAWDWENRRLVAVKFLDRQFSQSSKDLSQFRAEETLMAEIHHPGIVAGYGLHCIDGIWLMVMEYIDGYSFEDLIKRQEAVSEADGLLIIESVAAALSYAWDEHHVVHCDIKPANIMITSEGVIKITDLGLAERNTHPGVTIMINAVSDSVTGSPAYISPEQVFGNKELDWRTDVYSLGASIYHLVTGNPLFPGCSTNESLRRHCSPIRQAVDPRQYCPDLTEGFVRLLERMLVKDRRHRRDSWAEVYTMAQCVESYGTLSPREDDAVSSLRLD